MARLARISPKDISIHIIQRGNNRQDCFGSDNDHAAYAAWLKESSIKYSVHIHAWVMMTNHVHLLCTPRRENGVSQMMQAMGRQYVRYFNNKYKRTGTLWEGRYKSCLVQSETYLLEVYRYIEMNPVRAGIVSSPDEYHWSSYQINALGKLSDLCTPHPVYLQLGRDLKDCCKRYQELFSHRINNTGIFEQIRSATNKSMVVGNDQFCDEIEAFTGRRVREKKRGRPEKN